MFKRITWQNNKKTDRQHDRQKETNDKYLELSISVDREYVYINIIEL